ncbi:MAG: serine hydrolase, partial [Candidatus Obscuribacterales bacterium]|nr:serine hydrolase [Candidatus Obscuribacterales bacterium]
DFEHKVGNSSKTKFRLGSITKPITAMAIYQLEAMSELSVEDPVNNYIPDGPTEWEDIKIKHLINHTSGLVNFLDLPDYSATQRLPSSPWQTIDRFYELPLLSVPGEQTRYNSSAYVLLGAIIELVSGQSYESFLDQHIFHPLKMYNTGYDRTELVLENRARGYVRSKYGIENANFLDMSIPYAAGALISTVEDLYLLDQAIAHGHAAIPAEIIATMNTPSPDGYAAGWHVDRFNGRRRVGHSGGIDGFCTIMVRYPEQKLTIVVLSNVVSWQYSPERVSHDLASIVFGEHYQIPRIKQVVKLDPRKYHLYTGVYEVEPGLKLRISIEGERWIAQFSEQPSFEIFPESESDFFVVDSDAQISFFTNVRKEVTHMILIQDGEQTRANKL